MSDNPYEAPLGAEGGVSPPKLGGWLIIVLLLHVGLLGIPIYWRTKYSTTTRLFIIGIVAVTYLLSLGNLQSVFAMGVWCFSGFSALFPIVFAALYWRKLTALGAISGILAAFVSWAALFYLGVYAIMTLGAFAVVYVVAGKGDSRSRLADFSGLGWRRPLLGAAFVGTVVQLVWLASAVAGDDVASDARLLGLLAFHFACYGAGTPRMDDFAHRSLQEPVAIAPHAFVASLPRRLLGHPQGGALAAVASLRICSRRSM